MIYVNLNGTTTQELESVGAHPLMDNSIWNVYQYVQIVIIKTTLLEFVRNAM